MSLTTLSLSLESFELGDQKTISHAHTKVTNENNNSNYKRKKNPTMPNDELRQEIIYIILRCAVNDKTSNETYYKRYLVCGNMDQQ